MNYTTNERKQVTSMEIQVTELENGLRFTSPVDGCEVEIEGIKLNELDGNWHDYQSKILEMVANMGDGRWVFYDGGTTNYELIERNKTYYFKVTENPAQGGNCNCDMCECDVVDDYSKEGNTCEECFRDCQQINEVA